MKLYLRDRNPAMLLAWQEFFKNEKDVNVSIGNIFDEGPWLDCEAIISPANSFGFMDGGIDFVYSTFFGWNVQDMLREELWTKYNGELLVGQAEIIDMRKTNSKEQVVRDRVARMPYLISAPTMRVPMNVSGTVNAYLAFLAALKIAKQNNIKSILCPGLGTAIGQMPHRNCACQMYEAWKHYDKPRFFDVLGNAHQFHYSMMNPDTYLGSFFHN